MLKLESKDPILSRVWHSDRYYPLSLAYWELAIYGHVDGSVLLSFSWLRVCLDVVLQVCSLSPSQHEPFLRLAYLGQGAILDRQVFSLLQIICILYLFTQTL
jgi:hypothetical protein